MMIPLKQVREELNTVVRARFGISLSDDMWNYQVKEGNAQHVVTGRQSIAWLGDQVWNVLQASGMADKVVRGHKHDMLTLEQRERPTRRLEALSLLLAKEAATDQAVVRFRKVVLNDRFLNAEQVEPWVQRRVKTEGAGTHWLSVPMPPTCRLRSDPKTGILSATPDFKLSAAYGVRTTWIELLDYAVAGSRFVHRVPTAASGVLDQLRRLSERLAKRYGWQPAQATQFILTDAIPLLPAVRTRISSGRRGIITLEIDPSLNPRQLVAAYRRIRAQMFQGRRVRALSTKHLQLAAFNSERPEGESWQDKMRLWNLTHPRHTYFDNLKGFTRDIRQAERRLLAPTVTMENVFQAMTK